MNTKEAIKYINGFNVTCNDERKDNLKQVEFLLERGEKFEQMWEEFKKDAGYEWRMTAMKALEEKYFPKPVKKTITIEIKAKNEIDMKWFSDRFKSFKEQIIVDLPYTKIETKECD